MREQGESALPPTPEESVEQGDVVEQRDPADVSSPLNAAFRHIGRALDSYRAGERVSLALNPEEKAAIEAYIKENPFTQDDREELPVVRALLAGREVQGPKPPRGSGEQAA